jgi:predicted ATPase
VAEDEKQQRPVRKLTVNNFSVIKHAELEFGKITVLIGPQASGKSLLCKLAYFSWAARRSELQSIWSLTGFHFPNSNRLFKGNS